MKQNKMKVIHILNSLKYSGAEIMYVDAAPLFQEKGCELSVVATANDLGEFAPKFKAAGYEIFHKPYPPLKNIIDRIIYLYNFIFFLKEHNFDVVHIHSNRTMWGMSLCVWIAGKKSVYTFHSVFPTRKFTRPYHMLLRWTAKNWFKCEFQTISDSVHDNELKTFKNKTIKIDNWYGSNRFFPGDETEKIKFREEIGIDKDAFVIISIGGCSHIKRHSDIIQALPLIIEKVPNCIYVHLGEGSTEQEENELAKELHVNMNVLFMGNQSDVRKYLVASDIYVMTSKFEGISITTIEAMACNIPAVLYDVPGLRDFNKTVETAILAKEDYHALANELIDLYYNKTKLTNLVKIAKNYVDEKYSMETNCDKIFQLYSKKK